MSSAGQDPAPGRPRQPLRRGPLTALAVLAVAAALLVTGTLGLLISRSPAPSPSPAGGPAASGAAATGGPDAVPAATLPDGTPLAPAPDVAWGAIGELPPLQPIASLSPTIQDAAGIGTATAFTLASLGSVSATQLAAGLRVEPDVDLRISPGTDARSVTVKPAQALEPGRRYRVTLRTPDDALAGSWTFLVKQPLHVVTTLPGDQSTEVPVDTGIELTFDQDGVIDAQSHFAIEPAVKGRFETHGRTLTFVPVALQPETLYTVTLRPGIGVADSDVTLEREVRIRFETIAPEAPTSEVQVQLGRAVVEAGPDEAPVVSLSAWYPFADDSEEEKPPPDRLPIEVYHLPDAAAALKAARTLADAPHWATTSAGLVPTDGLPRAFAGEVGLQSVDGDSQALTLPAPLAAGSYLFVVPREGRDVQALLQVTSLASYSLVSTTKSLFWVNAIGGGPVPGVKVVVDGGPSLGSTDAHGLLVVPTPKSLLRADDATTLATLMAPDGATAIVPLGLRARLGTYPSDIHSDIEPGILERVTADADRWAPAFARAIRDAASAEAHLAGAVTLASLRAAPAPVASVLSDTSGGSDLGEVTDDRYWSILSTDRLQYRQDDTIHLWGYLRARDTLQVPSGAEVRLLVGDAYDDAYAGPPLATRQAKPRKSGAFEVAFDLEGVPLGDYMVQLVVDAHPVATRWVSVTVIRKPAYTLAVHLDHHVRIVRQRVKATVTARFYEGTVAPDVALAIGTDDQNVSATTGGLGTATTTLTAGVAGQDEESDESEGFEFRSVTASAAGAEEGEISDSSWLLVFPSDRWLTGRAILRGSRLRIKGTVSKVAVARLERQGRKTELTYELDPRGARIAGARVSVEVVRMKPIRTLVGQRYDFIAKRVVPRYESETREIPVATTSIRVGGDGAFSLSFAVPSARNEYRVVLRTTDGAGRVAKTTVYASAPVAAHADEGIVRTVLTMLGKPEHEGATYRTGETMRVTLGAGSDAYPSRPDGFLFVTAQQGLRDVIVQDSSQFRRPFTAADAPTLGLLGVHFTGRTFVADGASTSLDASERALAVRLTMDKPRYRPGEKATISARTTTLGDEPVAATVTLRGVDEKLFAMGAAEEEDPLGQLYVAVGDGLYRSYTSHPLPAPGFGEGGDTGGGGADGEREAFQDTLVFRQLQTGPDGVGRITVAVADDLTSWHISAAAVTADLRAGVGSILVPVGLPFFVESTLAPEFVLADHPVLRLRAFGSRLKGGQTVTFTVRSETLRMPAVTVKADAFAAVDVRLPALSVGEHRLLISGTANGALKDSLVRTFTVVPSRATRTTIRYASLDGPGGIETGSGLTSVIVSDAGRGRYLAALEDLAWVDGARLDQAVAATAARQLLVSAFGMDPSRYPASTFLPDAYQHGDDGIALMPYGSPSLDLTVRAVLADPVRFDVSALHRSMQAILDDPESTRERRIQALAGAAALGEDVLDEVRASAAFDDLTIRERLYVALAAAALGDEATAIDLERSLVGDHGERRGPWIRILDADSKDGSVEATSLLALIMAEVGDPLADDAEAYVEANPMLDDLSALQRLAFIRRALERAPRTASLFAYTVNGTRTVVDLEPGGSRVLTLTEPQSRTLRLEPLTGRVGVAVSRQIPLDASDVPTDPMLVLSRSVSPSGTIKSGQVVTVTLRLAYGSQALSGCTEVVDEVPSGLAPVGELDAWPINDEEEDGTPPAPDALSPYAMSGQRVAFCAEPDPGSSVVVMRYHTRVVSPGVYAWEPATAQSAIASETMTVTPGLTIELR